MAADGKFPNGFLWGTATAAHQVEGDNRNCDWWEFEKAGGIVTGDSSEVACDSYRRYREDFKLLRELKNNAHRLSIEWSRIEPVQGEFDARQIRHYRDVLGELREQRMSPMVTLHHFTNPIWFTRLGGWAASGAPEAFMPFVRRAVDELGDLVDFWITINEPNIYAHNGWVMGEFPPAHHGDLPGAYRTLSNLRRAHELAYREIKRRRPDTPTGLAHHKWMMIPADPRRRRDVIATRAAQAVMDKWPVGPGRLQSVVQASCDFIGLNHYTGSAIAFDPLRPMDQLIRRFNPPGLPISDFGWALNPVWMRLALGELKRLGKPIYVTESGIATKDDELRQKFLRDVLEQMLLAIEDGVDLRGYFHWTSIDNFEWARGYSMRFGLIDVDRKTMERTVKPSGFMYARIAQSNGLVD